MTEKEIRDILKDALAELDRRARKVILPSMLGLGLALSGCGDRAVSWADGQAPVSEAGTQPDLHGTDVQLPDLGNPIPPYMAPEPDAQITPPPMPDYAAPMYAAPMPRPEPDGGE